MELLVLADEVEAVIDVVQPHPQPLLLIFMLLAPAQPQVHPLLAEGELVCCNGVTICVACS